MAIWRWADVDIWVLKCLQTSLMCTEATFPTCCTKNNQVATWDDSVPQEKPWVSTISYHLLTINYSYFMVFYIHETIYKQIKFSVEQAVLNSYTPYKIVSVPLAVYTTSKHI